MRIFAMEHIPTTRMGVSAAVGEYDLAVIFGAGASMPLLPSQQDLIPELWKRTTPPYERALPIHLLSAARAYLARTFQGVRHRVSFEDVVGPLEIAEAEEYWFHFAGRDSKGRAITNQDVLDALDTWLTLALNPPSLPRRPGDPGFAEHFGASPDAKVGYARLVHLLMELGLLERTVFVSLNYDVLLDRSLLASEARDIDYQVEAFVDRPAAGKRVPLLKLHGSLNWRSCDACHVLVDLRHDYVGPRSRCPTCGAKRARPMLIRPTLLKDFRHRVWQDVWQAAGRALAGATRWLIVGYSLPLADVWMLRLLAQSVRSGRRRERSIALVNPDNGVLSRFGLLFPVVRVGTTFDAYIETCRAAGRLSWDEESNGGGTLAG